MTSHPPAVESTTAAPGATAMDAFLGMDRVDTHTWRVRITERIANMGGNLFGGAGLAIGIAALEQASERRLVWATAQYLGQAVIGEVVDVRVDLAVTGRAVTQGRVGGTVDGREIFTVSGALGERDVAASGSWAARPTVIDLASSPPRRHRNDTAASINAHLDLRIASGRDLDHLDGTPSTDGRSAMWARLPGVPVCAGALGVLGDWVPWGLSQALGLGAGGTSLDNTLRVVNLVPTEWVLLDIRIHAIERGFGHGLVHLWAEDATLMATASQSVMLRFWKDWAGPSRT